MHEELSKLANVLMVLAAVATALVLIGVWFL